MSAAPPHLYPEHAALRQLVAKLEEIHEHPRFKAVWQISQMHIGPYDGPTYTEELAAAKAALASHPGADAQGSGDCGAKAYVERAIASYVGDPADNQFQKGFLAALEVVRDEAFTEGKNRG